MYLRLFGLSTRKVCPLKQLPELIAMQSIFTPAFMAQENSLRHWLSSKKSKPTVSDGAALCVVRTFLPGKYRSGRSVCGNNKETKLNELF